jgi:GxxExxY protein
MSEEKPEPLFKEESQKLIGCALRVHDDLGHGFHEKPYENAMVIEFEVNGIPCAQQKQFPILYRERQVGIFIPDLIVFDNIIIDAKVIDKITDQEVGQMLNYLKVTGLRLGYIINFKHKKLQWKRVIR